jgi:hypothetical protein
MRNETCTLVPERDDVLLDYSALRKRWGKHPKTAARIMKRYGVRPMRLTARSVLFKLSDVLRVEAEAAVRSGGLER